MLTLSPLRAKSARCARDTLERHVLHVEGSETVDDELSDGPIDRVDDRDEQPSE